MQIFTRSNTKHANTVISDTTCQSLANRFKAGIAAMLLGITLLSVSGCSQISSSELYHSAIMRGQIVSLDGRSGVICIGERDNAEVGQVLNVVRHTRQTHRGKSQAAAFTQTTVGQVKITRIVDQHYSDIDVLSGDLRETDTVELQIK